MIRTRLLWFTLGFASASGAIAQFVCRDLWADRNSRSRELMDKFNALDARVSNMESVVSSSSTSSQD
ncbi:uncharacterized protein LOC127241579 isoform X2 [Andrographis paniculata]|uniref:uncharacterized protein LOC127241579 isoform X2 n=1 Tax=Andrographis paniculata TaxID=175694 RepID=UPI0021E818DD|nr:uncharacterized protein LOC127241579 isoform X2 [Andrographis paniculata]